MIYQFTWIWYSNMHSAYVHVL